MRERKIDHGSPDPSGEPRSANEVTESEAPADPPAAPESVDSGVDFRDRWLRSEADLQNFRRRSQRDAEESVRFAEDRILLEMIAQLDDLERALSMAREAGAADPWVQGVQLVANRMTDDLARHGVTPMKPEGQRFDPEQHEALMEVDAAEGVEPGRVAKVVREGYRRGPRALRAARVVVSRRPDGSGA